MELEAAEFLKTQKQTSKYLPQSQNSVPGPCLFDISWATAVVDKIHFYWRMPKSGQAILTLLSRACAIVGLSATPLFTAAEVHLLRLLVPVAF